MAPVTLLALPYPAIDPVLVEIGPFAIRWYALAYIAALLLGWRYMLLLNRRDGILTRHQVDDLFVWVALGVILGGRLGYVLFYNPAKYAADPLEILQVWEGGMSFHGGLLGVALALYLFARTRRVALLKITDMLACTVPIGLFLGRIANFINGELFGRTTNASWGMVFPGGGPLPRHPSQLYEAFLEGVVLFTLMAVLYFRTDLKTRAGMLTGVFLVGYGLFRGFVELFRAPDPHLGTIFLGLTMGQILSIPMVAAGVVLIHRGLHHAAAGHGRG